MTQISETNPYTAIPEKPLPRAQTLNGKSALVTGGSRGIGRAIALRLAQLGAAVAICGRDRVALDETLAALQSIQTPAHAESADVTRAADVANLVANTEKAMGPISILVNNAGVGLFGPVQERSEADWEHVLNTNLKSVFLVSRAVIPGMMRRGGGDIINISSLAGLNTFAGGALYCASKWGLQGLTGCMAEDLRAHGIRVSSVCPGSVATEFSGKSAAQKPNALQASDVAHAVETIVTQAANSFISQLQIRPLRK
jgi:NAD(P)-dependent dehydrogenase (short-subunit alcohol dehydrogenase family)